MPNQMSHINSDGTVHMVDVGSKPVLWREAVAEGYLVAQPATLDLVDQNGLPKGDAVATARLAGIMAAKKCADLIPLCHSLPLEQVLVQISRLGTDRMHITATARVTARTGVEMEALTAVSVSALTLYDMMKAVDKTMHIEGVRLVQKVKRPVACPNAPG